jgi:hypothetical protein
MAVLGLGWWIWDCVGHVKKYRSLRRRAREVERARLRALRNGQGGPAEGAAGGRQGQAANRAAGGRPAAGTNTPTTRSPRGISLDRRMKEYWTNIALAYDRRILRLFYFTPDVIEAGRRRAALTVVDVHDRRIPRSDENLPLAPVLPSALWRYFILPLVLFFITLVPSLDSGRRAAILQREKHMRLLVEKLSAEKEKQLRKARENMARSAQAARADASVSQRLSRDPVRDTRDDDAEPDASISPVENIQSTPEVPLPAAFANQGATETNSPAPAPVPWIPRFLCPEAIAYYRRVITSTERIDWDAERQAQAELLGNNRNAADAAGNGDVDPAEPAAL